MNIFLENLFNRFPELKKIEKNLENAFETIKETYSKEGTVFVCGNGGSASDSEHIVGELMKGFILKRKLSPELRDKFTNMYGEEGNFLADNLQQGLRAIALTSHPALNTAFANDVNPGMIFAQQVFVLGRKGDVIIGLSTSGNSHNVVKALEVAKAMGLKTIAMTGEGGGKCAQIADVLINVPHHETYRIQEYHLPIYHTLCMMLEDHFYGC